MKQKGFTFIELLIGLAMSVTIFILVTNLVVSLLFSTTKGKRLEELAQARNDIETDIGTASRWATSISYVGGVFSLDQNKYTIQGGRFMKNGVPLTSNSVVVENLEIIKQTVSTPVTESASGQGLIGTYFSGTNFNTMITTHTDYGIDFNWAQGSPAQKVPADQFSVRWTGQVEIPRSGQYTFYTRSDDGVRLWVNNQLLINNWTDHSAREDRGTIMLDGGQLYDIRLEYYEKVINAVISLSWSGPAIAKEIIPAQYLHEVAAQSSLNIKMDLVHKETGNIRDAINLFISPREGIVQSIEPPTPTPSPSPSATPTSNPGSATPKPTTPPPTKTPVPLPSGSATPTQQPTQRPTPSPTPKPKP